jgi:hypothetical protein
MVDDSKKITENPAPGQGESPAGPSRGDVLRYTAKALRQLGRIFHAEDLEKAFPEAFGERLTPIPTREEMVKALETAIRLATALRNMLDAQDAIDGLYAETVVLGKAPNAETGKRLLAIRKQRTEEARAALAALAKAGARVEG